MIKLFVRLFAYSAVLFFATTLRAQDEERKDAEGCKDSPLFTRFPDSIINSCDNKEYEQADLPWKDGGTKHVEGDYHYWDIATRPGTSEIQVFRNFQTAIKNAGFTIDYAMSPSQIVAHKGVTWIFIDSRGDYYYQTIVTEKEMKQEVTADASTLSDEINKSEQLVARSTWRPVARSTEMILASSMPVPVALRLTVAPGA